MTTIYTVNNKVLKNSANDKWLIKKEAPDYNPLGLDPGVFRIKVKPGISSWQGAQRATRVTGTSDVYDVQFTESNASSWDKYIALEVLGANTTGWTTGLSGMFATGSNLTSVALFDTSSATNLSSMFYGCSSLTSVPLFDTSSATNLSAMFNNCSSLTSVPLFDTSSATNLSSMFYGCSSLTSVPLFDTSSATNMSQMIQECSSLTSVPLFDTSSATNLNNMFAGCTNVESGALALYQQASTQTTPPSQHIQCFYNCGSNTTTGAAELAQIPSDWKS